MKEEQICTYNAPVLQNNYYKIINFSFLHFYSPVDPLPWMGAISMRVQTADKIIHMTQSINVLWSEKLFVRNKSIIKAFYLRTVASGQNMSP